MRVARRSRRWAFVPAGVAAAAGAVVIGYVRLMDSQEDRPERWFLGGLLLAAGLATYGTLRSAPCRAEAIGISGVVLMTFGILAMFSIGLPLLIAGVTAVAFALQVQKERVNR